ncbi:hypothetical protein P4J10_14040 [Bacillus cereus]|uniref:hypothetical protein n=1 Tax=Bacillus cereus group TaxID=86661 RepID=UPI000B439BE3|nr:hypothetical protein [Bacillus thuringiensis]MEB9467793.1 hypothetical protein [Bacillus cereus]MEC0031189.1 hypothetical protein [Bacillus cereus]MRA82400.1 hypothetical protein [Bacillus thuringiensis]OUA16679.1 hypothetical protein BK776_30510 [Bacillus thuringiensis serovar aizawai]
MFNRDVHGKRIKKAQERTQSAQEVFVKAIEDIDASDEHLDAVIKEAKAEIANLQAFVEDAESSKVENETLRKNIQGFVNVK